MQGLIPDNYFEGGQHMQADGSTRPHLAQWLAAVQNDLVASLGIKGVQTITIADAPIVAAADGSDLTTLLALSVELKATHNGIGDLGNDTKAKLDPVQEVAIAAADAQLSVLAVPTDLPTAIAFLNDLKAKYNAAVALYNELKADLNTESTVAIAAADAVVTAVADASDQSTSEALANDIKVQLNIARTLINEIKTDLNAAAKIDLASRALI